MKSLSTRAKIATIARWLWPTAVSRPTPEPTPSTHPITWEQWHGWPVRVVSGPFKGRIGMAGGTGWGQIEVVFRNYHRVWFHGDLLELLRPRNPVAHSQALQEIGQKVIAR